MLLAALCVGESIILGKKIAANHPAMTNAVGMSVGAALLLLLSVVARESWVLPRSTDARWAVVYLVTLGSGLLFVLLLVVIKRWTASATSYLFVLFPVATLVLGAVLADEPVTLQAAIGAVVVMAGVWFGALSPGARRHPAPPPVAAPAATSS
jgi:drug/metabolite transporter (DMT)-like permease